jgi:hypothetical protein
MLVDTGHQTKANCPTESFGHLPLVYWSQSRVLGVLDPASLGHELGHDGKVLFMSASRRLSEQKVQHTQ